VYTISVDGKCSTSVFVISNIFVCGLVCALVYLIVTAGYSCCVVCVMSQTVYPLVTGRSLCFVVNVTYGQLCDVRY
jgi:hypothetical protein